MKIASRYLFFVVVVLCTFHHFILPSSTSEIGDRNGNPLHCSCLGNPMDRGIWRATVHGVTKNQAQLSN